MNIHSATRRRFVQGAGTVFVCRCCKRRTRPTNGDHAQTGNCAICFDLAGIENTLSDNGPDETWPNYADETRTLLQQLQKAGGDLGVWTDLQAALAAWDARK